MNLFPEHGGRACIAANDSADAGIGWIALEKDNEARMKMNEGKTLGGLSKKIERRVDRMELQILCSEDCGNAPKKKVLLEFNVAFARHDIDVILQHVSEDIVWNRVGERIIRGKAAFAEVIGRMAEGSPATRIEIANIITHGNTASANGVITYGRAQTAFCDVYRFNSFAKHAKIKEMTTYAIPLPE